MLGVHYDFLWVDLEMSGLDPVNNVILQFACVLTDRLIKKELEGPHLILHCDEDHLKKMDQWNTSHHSASGLAKACLESKITAKEAEAMILQFLGKQGITKEQLIIAGNSVHVDKLFLFHHMPKLYGFLHYRILDVSSIKILVNAKLPALFYHKNGKHRAIDDIRESIAQLKYYLKNAFK